jgi:hypothetical protein
MYEELRIYNPFSIPENAQMIKNALPKGQMWNFPLNTEQQIELRSLPRQFKLGILVLS